MSILGDSYFIRNTIFGEREILGFQTDNFGSIPQIVYKYLDISIDHHKESLIEDYMWFSDPTTFNDPFDCKTSFAYQLLAEDEILCRNYYEALSKTNSFQLSEEERKRFIDGNVNMLTSNKSNIDFFKKFESDSSQERIADLKHFGVHCTCMINDNILLWSHYANSHQGICLGLNVNKLLETYHFNQNVGSGEVHYGDFPLISPPFLNDESAILNTFKPLFLTKARFWNYELEYRFVDYPCTNRKKPIGDILD